MLKEFGKNNKEKLKLNKIKEELILVNTYQVIISFKRDQLDIISKNNVNILYKLDEAYIEHIAEYKKRYHVQSPL